MSDDRIAPGAYPSIQGKHRLTRARCVIGIDVGGTAISAGLVTLRAEIVHRVMVGRRGDESIVDRILTIARDLCSRAPVRAIGVGVPGAVDFRPGIVRDVFTIPQLSGLPLRSILQRKLRVPVALDNDVNAMALAEARWGAARNVNDFVLIAVGTGAGGAVVLDHKLRRGAHGYAGEVGHATVHLDGPACFCGSRGCLKAYAAGPDLVQQFSSVGSFGDEALTPAEILALARGGDERAKAVIDRAGQALGAACANLVNTLDPELIVIGGSVGSVLLRAARTWANIYTLPGLRGKVPVVRSQWRKANAFLGGAALAWDLRSPPARSLR